MINKAAYLFVPGHQPDRGALANGEVNKTIQVVTRITVLGPVSFHVDAAFCFTHDRLVGDNADGARLAALAIERALRAGQRFNAGNVVQVDIQDLVDRGDWLLVQVVADAGHGSGVVAVAATGNTDM